MSTRRDDIGIIFELCKTRENKELDFKLKLNLSEDKTKYEISKDICAFANGENGGRIIIGVEDKTKKIVGIDEPIDCDRIQQIVSKRIFPAPEFTIYSYPLNSKFIDVIKIATGKAVHWMGENKSVYFRRDAITDTATPEEIFILSYTRVVNRDILEHASKRKVKHWDPADTKLSDGKSELDYIEWSTIPFQGMHEDPFTARNIIPIPMAWTGLAPNYPDYPSSSYFAANCGFMFNIQTQESVLIELQNKINDLHKIHSQAWTLQVDERESAGDRTHYMTGFSGQSLVKTVNQNNLHNVNMAWIIRTLEAVNYIITGTFEQGITVTAYLPYIPPSNEFPTVNKVNENYEIRSMSCSLFLVNLEHLEGRIGSSDIIFGDEDYVTKNRICDAHPYLYLKEEWIEWIKAVHLSDFNAFVNKLTANSVPYSEQLKHMQPQILFGNISTSIGKHNLVLTGFDLYAEKYNPRPISHNTVLCLLFNPQVHAV